MMELFSGTMTATMVRSCRLYLVGDSTRRVLPLPPLSFAFRYRLPILFTCHEQSHIRGQKGGGGRPLTSGPPPKLQLCQ